MPVSGIKLKTLPAVTVSTAGTAVKLYSTTMMVYEAMIVALDAGTHYIGDSTVTSSNGAPFSEDGEFAVEPPSRSVDQFDLSKVYVNSTTNGAEFRVIAWIRE